MLKLQDVLKRSRADYILGMILHISSVNIHIYLLSHVIIHYIANSPTCLTKSIMSSASGKQGSKRGIFCPRSETRV
jgi:hypothetical protein